MAFLFAEGREGVRKGCYSERRGALVGERRGGGRVIWEGNNCGSFFFLGGEDVPMMLLRRASLANGPPNKWNHLTENRVCGWGVWVSGSRTLGTGGLRTDLLKKGGKEGGGEPVELQK
eukprot:Sspe_Gene.101111::Locus_75703_Transcript_1_1_Confidence_1.000_Length_492::g.101111::m.101111